MITKPKPGFMINHLHPLSRGLVAWYLFNEGDGTRVNDYSNNRSNGTMVAGASGLPLWTGSPKGQALQFGGSANANRVDIPISLQAPLSIVALVNLATHNASELTSIIGDTSGAFSLNVIDSTTDGTNCLLFFIDGATDMRARSIDNVIVLNQWQHIIVTWTGENAASSVNYYINGAPVALKASQDGVTLPSLGSTWSIGGTSSTRTWAGPIDSLAVYNRVLSPLESQQLSTMPYANVLSPLNSQPLSPLILAGSIIDGFGDLPGETLAGIGNIFRRRRRLHR